MIRKILFLLSIIFVFTLNLYSWSPNKFGVSCESYAYILSDSNDDAISNVNCISQQKREIIEKYLSESLQSLKKKNFKSPKGKSLGPIVTGIHGEKVVQIYTGYDGLAVTVGQCRKGGTRGSSPYSYITINEKLFEKIPPFQVFVFVTHELTHVIQDSQKFYLKSNSCHKIPLWLTEGTADAITYDLTYKKFRYAPSYKNGIYKSFYGLRKYYNAFTVKGVNNIQTYRTSSFWNFLEEYYYKNNYKFVSVYLNKLPSEIVAREDWLAWLNQLLISDKKGPQKPLYLVYPEFIAHYANWGKDKYKKLGKSSAFRERHWLSNSFKGCQNITLSPSNPKKNILLKLEPISAQCIKIAIDGLVGNKEANIKIMAYDSSKQKLDNLHVSTAYAQAKFVATNKDFNCYRDVKFKNKAHTCINTPILGKIPSSKNNKKSLVKIWKTEQQKFTSSNDKNLYLISHVPVKPSDKKHGNRKKQEVSLTIALDYTKFKTSSKKTAKKTAKKVSAQVGLTGHTGTENGSDIPTSGTEGMDFSSMMNNEGLSKLMMGMNVPDVTASFRGIHIITLKDYESTGEDIKTNMTLSLVVEEPIAVGSVGTFKANVMGSLGEEEDMIKMTGMSVDLSNMIKNTGDEPSANIKVLEYSEKLLHIEVQGSYCQGLSMEGKCLNVESFSAKIFKPLGLAYGSGGVKSMDTEGMKIYRKNHYNRIKSMSKGRLGLPSGFENIGSNQDDKSSDESSSQPNSNGVYTCNCSCKEYKDINQQMEASGDTRPDNAEALMGCMMSCMMQYMKCDEG